MTTNENGRKIPARQVILGLLALVLSLGLSASVAFAGLPANSAAGPPIQGKSDRQNPGSDPVVLVDAQPDSINPLDCTITGSISGTEPTKNSVNGAASACGSTTPCPGELAGAFHYDTYPIVNSTGSAVCATITLSDPACIYATVYSAPPTANGCTNYVADSNLGGSFQVTIPANTTYYLAVEEFVEGQGCPNYTVNVTGAGLTCGTGGTPTITTATTTRTPTAAVTTTRTPTAAATTTRTATGQATATCVPGGPSVFQGAIEAGDPTQTNRLFRDEPPSTCALPQTCAQSTGTFRYDTYTLTNTTGVTACVSITLDPIACTGTSYIQSAAYLGSYNPANVCANYLGDIGNSPEAGTPKTYEVSVPAGGTLVVVVNESFTGGCPAYTLTVTGLGGAGCPTGTPATATRTVTGTGTVAPPSVTTTRTSTVTTTRTVTVVATTAVPSMTTTRTSTAIATTTSTSVATGTRTSTAVMTVTRTSTAGSPTASMTPCTGRVTICHRTGNGNSHTITVSCNALPAHLAHGDTVGACPAGTPRPRPNRFSDVQPSEYFYHFALDLNDDGALGGYNDGTFRPYNQATRGQFVKIAVLAFHRPLYTGSTQSFSDVPPSHTFYQYIETARRDNIIGGYSDGTFRPFANVTRGQIAKIAVESAGMADLSTGTPSFSDVPTNHTFYAYIETAYANGILSGYSDGTFRPNADATRGQVAKIIDLATHP